MVKRGGWNPHAHWKGESLVAELVTVLWTYSTAAWTRMQESGESNSAGQFQSPGSSTLSGHWTVKRNPDDKMMVSLRLAQNSFQNLEVNWESRSEPMSIGIL